MSSTEKPEENRIEGVKGLPRPGEVIVLDYREEGGGEMREGGEVRAVQWNVERNYEADAVVEELRRLDADIYFLQEIDIHCKRSGGEDHFERLCRELKCMGGFVCEFEELDSPLRKKRDAGGGVHGNAVLTRYEGRFRALAHEPEAFQWERDGGGLGEPRRGKRYACVGEIDVPGLGEPVLGYSLHLEVFCGIMGRVGEFSTVLADVHRHGKSHPRQLVFGDLNTMAHSVARLSPLFARDRYRWGSLGWTEAEWWEEHVLGFGVEDGGENGHLRGAGWGPEVAMGARNDGLWDPWDPVKDVTICPKAYRGWYSGKLDWTLVRGWRVVGQWMGNDDYSASDHKWLMLDVAPVLPDEVVVRKRGKRAVMGPGGGGGGWRVAGGVMAVAVVLAALRRVFR